MARIIRVPVKRKQTSQPLPIVYVDDSIHPRSGRMWCYMFSENIEYLHRFAERLGIGLERFRQPPQDTWSYYDVTAGERTRAIGEGAVQVDHWMTMEIAYKQQGRWTAENQLRVEQGRERTRSKTNGRTS